MGRRLNRWHFALAAGAVAVLTMRSEALGRQDEAPLRSVAETSDFQATSHFEEVVKYLDDLAATSEKATRVDLGVTHEGRTLPMIVLADPAVQEPDDLQNDDRLVVLMIGDIHAGEVDGKEALCILARELIESDDAGLLKKLVLCIAPIYNADGNERFGPDNRPGQVGPAQGMGVRHNAQNLDLNRDFIKLEAPETRALLRFTRHWDPDVFIDTHTTNGSHHRYLVTWSGPKVPAGERSLIDYFNNTMMPAVTTTAKDEYDLDIFPYGNFAADHTRWESFPAEARYGTSYFGLRNMLGILSESYSYASYKDRIFGSKHFVESCLKYLAAHDEEVRQELAKARSGASSRARMDGDLALRSIPVARPDQVIVMGYTEEQVDGRSRPTDEPRDYAVDLVDTFTGSLNVKLPRAYLIPSRLTDVIDLLKFHGISVEELTEDITLGVEVDRVAKIDRQPRPFQGHRLTSVEIERRFDERMIGAGTYVVYTNQSLAPLAGYILESQSEDGLVAWNFLDDELEVDADYPILRLVEEEPLNTARLPRPDDERTFGLRIMHDTSSLPSFNGSPARVSQWVDDDHYVLRKGRSEYSIDALTGRSQTYEAPPRPDTVSTSDMAAALEKIATIGEANARNLANAARRNVDPTGTGAFVEFGNDLYYVKTDGSEARRLTSTPGEEELVEFSPNGRLISFVRDHDLYVVDVDTGTERALTTGGSDTLLHGKADWVYFEEVFGRNWRTYWWSPDSQSIAFFETDRSDVPDYTLVDNGEHDQRVENARYPKPGDPNPIIRVGIVSAAGDTPVYADLSGYNKYDLIVARLIWQKDSSGMLLYLQNRVQSWLDVARLERRGGAPERWWRETTGAWVDVPGRPYYLDDGTFLFESERTGWKQWHHYSAEGKEIRAVTHGEWVANSIVQYDKTNDWLYILGKGENRLGMDLFRVHLDGSDQHQLTNGQGIHRVTISPGGTYFIDSWSDFDTPSRTELRRTDGSLVRTIDSNPVYGMDEYDLGQAIKIVVPARDGYPLDAHFILPPDYQEGTRYPVWLSTYAGPSAPTVSDRWGGGYTRDQDLASDGVIVLSTHPRSASAYGAVSAWAAYKQLGVSELRDIEDVLQWLIDQGYADPDRIGITGYSYGGYMTAYALTHSTMFSCGIAGAPPTDWREYDTIYTERYMLTPQDNPEGYRVSSVIEAAENLHGFLRINHGALDDNVHPQNTVRLVKALQDANKDFEEMFYPGFRHGIFNRYYQRSNYEFILKHFHLTPAEAPPPRKYRWKHEAKGAGDESWFDEGD